MHQQRSYDVSPGDNVGLNIKGLDKNTMPKAVSHTKGLDKNNIPGEMHHQRVDNAGLIITGPDKNNMPNANPGGNAGVNIKGPDKGGGGGATPSTPSSAGPRSTSRTSMPSSGTSSRTAGFTDLELAALFSRMTRAEREAFVRLGL